MNRSYLEGELRKYACAIEDPEMKSFTLALLDEASEDFWSRPASRKHHPIDERGECGNLLHTVRVVRLVNVLADCCDVGQVVRDILTSAAVLHDICRYGLDGHARSTVEDHPHLVRELATKCFISCRYDDLIFRVIGSHMGRWGNIPYKPATVPMDTILHVADAISAHAEQVWTVGEGKT